jgi:hypothetical protein
MSISSADPRAYHQSAMCSAPFSPLHITNPHAHALSCTRSTYLQRVLVLHELRRGHFLVQNRYANLITITVALVRLLLLHDVGFLGGVEVQLLKHVLGIEKLGIDFLGREVAEADDEDLGGLISGRGGLGCFYALEQLVQDPQECVVITGPEHLGDEGTAGAQEVDSELEGEERQLCLCVCIFAPCRADVGGSVVHDEIRLMTRTSRVSHVWCEMEAYNHAQKPRTYLGSQGATTQKKMYICTG